MQTARFPKNSSDHELYWPPCHMLHPPHVNVRACDLSTQESNWDHQLSIQGSGSTLTSSLFPAAVSNKVRILAVIYFPAFKFFETWSLQEFSEQRNRQLPQFPWIFYYMFSVLLYVTWRTIFCTIFLADTMTGLLRLLLVVCLFSAAVFGATSGGKSMREF